MGCLPLSLNLPGINCVGFSPYILTSRAREKITRRVYVYIDRVFQIRLLQPELMLIQQYVSYDHVFL